MKNETPENDYTSQESPNRFLSGIFARSPYLIFSNKSALFDGKDYWIHRWLPSNTLYAVPIFLGIGLISWFMAFLLAGDRWALLLSKEWHMQPAYLAGHFFTAWMFVLPFTRLFHRALVAMEGPKEDILEMAKVILGKWGMLGATFLSIPFQIMLLVGYLNGTYIEFYLDPEAGVRLVDYWMMLLWALEWWVNGYIWFILIGFIALTIRAMIQCNFKGQIEEILIREKYKPFLLLIVQGSSSCLFFCLITTLYVWYADGETADYIGLGVTVGLLVFGFTPPWLMLRQKLDRMIAERHQEIGNRLVDLESTPIGKDTLPDTIAIQEFSLITRINYLDRLQVELGQKEGRSVILRLLIPLATVAWNFIRPIVMG